MVAALAKCFDDAFIACAPEGEKDSTVSHVTDHELSFVPHQSELTKSRIWLCACRVRSSIASAWQRRRSHANKVQHVGKHGTLEHLQHSAEGGPNTMQRNT